MIKAQILRAVPAAGKTKAILENVKVSGKCIIASISRQLNKQSYEYYKKIGGKDSIIIDGDHSHGFDSVLKAIDHFSQKYRVLFITHHALLRIQETKHFSDHDLYIDEVPDIVSLESFKINTNIELIEKYCDIKGDSSIKTVSIKRGMKTKIKQQIQDGKKELDCISELLFPLFVSLIQGHPVKIKRDDDGYIIFFVKDETTKAWENFKSVTIACANFEDTFTGHVLKYWQNWEFVDSPLISELDFHEYPNSSRVNINVLCDKNWSKSVADQEIDGETLYSIIKDKVDKRFSKKSFIYTINKIRSKLNGKQVSYNPHGLNRYINESNIVALFSYNPQPWQIPILHELAKCKGLEKRALVDAFIVSKYLEPIFQLCTRGDIRKITSKKKIDLCVPDMRAAEYLKSKYLPMANISTDFVVETPKRERKTRKITSMPKLLNMNDNERQNFYYWQRKSGKKLDISEPSDIVKAKKWLNSRRK